MGEQERDVMATALCIATGSVARTFKDRARVSGKTMTFSAAAIATTTQTKLSAMKPTNPT